MAERMGSSLRRGGVPGALLVLAFAAPLLIAAVTREARAPFAIHGNDGFLNFAYARSTLVSGDLDFTDDFAAFDALGRGHSFAMADTPLDPTTGRPVNRYGWGSALLWAPSLLVAHLICLLVPALSADGLSVPYFLAVRLGTAAWGAVGLALLLRVARRRLMSGGPHPPAPSPNAGRGGAERETNLVLWAGVALLGATNLGFYLFLHPSMSTAPAFALAGLLIWQIDRLADDPRPWRWAALGLTGALLFVTRYGDLGILLGLLPAIWVAQRGPRGAARPALGAFLVGAAPVVVIQMLIWWSLYGSPLSGPAPYLGDDYQWSVPGHHSLAVLFSFHHGWVAWHPMVLLGLAGLVLIARDRTLPRWLRLTPLAVLVHLLLLGAWPVWTGGASFGARLMTTALAVTLLGLVATLRWIDARAGRAWVIALVAALTLWNLSLTAQYALEMIPRQAPVSPAEMAVNSWHLLRGLLGG